MSNHLTDDELRAKITGAGWAITVERPEKLNREGNSVWLDEALYSASKENNPLSVASSLKQLVDVCLGRDAAVASLKPVPVADVVEVPVVLTLEDMADRVAQLEEKLAGSESA